MKYLFTILLLLVIATACFPQDEIVFFSDSNTGNQFYDSSFGYKTAPSLLELAATDKFPVDAQHPYQGAHSLRLHWTSKSGGDWGMAVASIGWKGQNFTAYDSIVYWINSPNAVAQADLPDLALEDLTNKKSARTWLGDYFAGVDDDTTTWQRIVIPISAFQPENADFTKIKTIFHYQKNADEVEHLVWLDEFRIIKKETGGSTAPAKPIDLNIAGYDSRIDIQWRANTETDLLGYYIYRSSTEIGQFTKLNPVTHDVNLYSDFFGENNKTYYYCVTAVNQNYEESIPSDTVSATARVLSDDELLTSVQEATFRYFWDYGHPVSGLARERKGSGETCTSGGTGFGLMTIMVGAERGFVPRDSAAARIVKMLRFLQDVTPRYHGAWSHWINGTTGETIPFSQYDNGGDIVETAYLVEGLLTVRQYFDQANAIETELRTCATQLWEEVEWDWYRRLPTSNKIYWHWSPNYGWQMNMVVEGWNETMIVYLLAIASPTHAVPASLWDDGWAGRSDFVNGNSYYGYKQWVGWPMGGPLFFTQYSFMGFDPRNKADKYCNYFDNNRNISLIQRAYSSANPENHQGYNELVWGLTASDDPWGYSAHDPNNDNGTISPTAAISAMPYTPEESFAALKHFYFVLGPQLWGEFGFKDAFNLDQNWFATSFLAIDQGPMVPMIENSRTGLCWQMFMANSEIDTMLKAIGWTTTDVEEQQGEVVCDYELNQNYPNPFNSETVIQFNLSQPEQVTLTVLDVSGRLVDEIISSHFEAGKHQVVWHGTDCAGKKVPSGVYIYSLKAGHFNQAKKLIHLQ